jgi:integrase
MPTGDGLYKKRGIWYYRFTDWNGKTRAKSTKTSNFGEAREIRTRDLAAIAEGAQPGGSRDLIFRTAAARWLERRLIGASEETRRHYTGWARNANNLLGDMPLGQITADTIARYQIERAHRLGPASVNKETKIIASILLENDQWQRIRNHHRRLREPRSGGRVVRPDEMEKLLAAAEERKDVSVLFLVIPLAQETGLRHKEMRTLRIGDVNIDQRSVTVRRTGTKTDSGARRVPLTELAAAAAAQLLDRARLLGAVEHDHHLFPGFEDVSVPGRKRKERRVNPAKPLYSFKDSWETLRRKAGVDPHLRLHDFRHSCVTDLAASGVPSRIAMRIMGWSSAAMMRRYEHLQDEETVREMARVEAYRKAREAELHQKRPPQATGTRPQLRRVK